MTEGEEEERRKEGDGRGGEEGEKERTVRKERVWVPVVWIR